MKDSIEIVFKTSQRQINTRYVKHAPVFNEIDYDYLILYIIPSVQPTHTTNDMYWAKDGPGAERENGACAFHRLMNKNR